MLITFQVACLSSLNATLKAEDDEDIKRVEDFKYLGSFVMSTAKDIKVRKAKAWTALNGMEKIWKSDISRALKERFFTATVESVLLYGSKAWSMTSAMEKSLNCCYTRMLRAAFNISWRDHLTNEELYLSIPQVTEKVRSRRLSLLGTASDILSCQHMMSCSGNQKTATEEDGAPLTIFQQCCGETPKLKQMRSCEHSWVTETCGEANGGLGRSRPSE